MDADGAVSLQEFKDFLGLALAFDIGRSDSSLNGKKRNMPKPQNFHREKVQVVYTPHLILQETLALAFATKRKNVRWKRKGLSAGLRGT